MTDRQLRLLQYVITQHGGQPRKYNLEPYWFHVYRVGRRAEEQMINLGFEKGLCHDLIEDVKGLTLGMLTKALLEMGYGVAETNEIVKTTHNLTDVYTSEAYPDLNRSERKKLEAHRLWEIPGSDQTIKYCDLEDNTSTIVPYDEKFAKVYLAEKRYILSGMNKGSSHLFNICKQLANEQSS